MITVQIYRKSGPSTDQCVEADFPDDQLQTIKDVLGMVNAVSGDVEGWYCHVVGTNKIVIPHAEVRDQKELGHGPT